MNGDIYRKIALYLPLADLANLLCAVKINREALWKLKLMQDYDLSNPANLPYCILYRLKYRYHSLYCRVDRPGRFQRSIGEIKLERYGDKYISQIQQRDIINYRRNINEFLLYQLKTKDGTSYYIGEIGYLLKKLSEKITVINKGRRLYIPRGIGLMHKYDLYSFEQLFRYYYFQLDLTHYLTQIDANTRQNCNKQFSLWSTFEDWRGVKWVILYNDRYDLIRHGTIYESLTKNIIQTVRTVQNG